MNKSLFFEESYAHWRTEIYVRRWASLTPEEETTPMSETTNVRTVAQALRRVKELKGRHAELTRRAQNALHWVGDETPTFEFTACVEQRGQVALELVQLKSAISHANATTEAEFEGKLYSLQALVFLMAEFKDELSFYESLTAGQKSEVTVKGREHEWDETTDRHVLVTTSVVHHYAMVERSRVEKVDELRQRIGVIDGLLQSANHTTAVVLA